MSQRLAAQPRWSTRFVPLLLALSAGACASIIGLDDYDRVDGPAPVGTGGGGGASPCAPGATEACYSGPAGTEGQGICQGGTRTCSDAGQWGACGGEVLPSAEVCATPVDDDCNGQVNEGGADCDCVPGSMIACYTGPAGTRGVGLCTDGQQACNDSGNGYGPCMGEVLPATEQCGTAVDEDCDGAGWYANGDLECACEPGATRDCYTGPPTTEGVGLCVGGLEACLPDGLGWGGMCVGEVLPVAEDCSTSADEDCDGSDWFTDGDTDCACQPGTTQACYLGPSGTENVGPCHDGMWTCNADGLGYGACMGEVLPSVEVCNNAVLDEDCSGAACPSEVEWARAAGGTGAQYAYDVAVDGNGNVLVAATFQGAFTFGPASFNSIDTDSVLLKLDPQGNLLWAKLFGATGAQVVRGIATDNFDNIYVAGNFDQSMTAGPIPLSSSGPDDHDFFVAKLDPDGNALWAQDYGTATVLGVSNGNDQRAYDIAVNGPDNIIVTGWFDGEVIDTSSGNPVTVTSSGSGDLFVTRLGANGAMQWFVKLGDAATQVGRRAVFGAGVQVVGYGAGSFDVIGPLNNGAGTDILSLGFTPMNGNPTAASHFGTMPDIDAAGLDIALDPGGNLLLTGYYDGAINLGGGQLPSTGQSRFITKRTGAGAHVWSKGFPAATSLAAGNVGAGIASDSGGNVLVTGHFSGTTDLGGGSITSAGNGVSTDIFMLKLDPDGSHLWSRTFSETSAQYAVAIAAAPTDHAVVVGNFTGGIDFGIATVTANGVSYDISTLFIAKLAP